MRAPVLAALVGQVQLYAVLFREFSRTGQEIRVDVRLRRRDDAHALALGKLKIAIDVALRIDHDRLARLLTADQVRILRQRLIGNTSKQHGVSRVSAQLRTAAGETAERIHPPVPVTAPEDSTRSGRRSRAACL